MKCPITRQRPFPGPHGGKRQRRASAYALQLREKQKVKRFYGILERQFRKYVEEAKAEKGQAGLVLLQKLELRLDNIVYRLGLGKSRAHCRQLIRQGKFTVNGRSANIPSLAATVGDKIAPVDSSVEVRKNLILPDWLSWDKRTKIGTVQRQPQREELEQDLDEALIIEYYSR